MDHIKRVLSVLLFCLGAFTAQAQQQGGLYSHSIGDFNPVGVFYKDSIGWMVPGKHGSPWDPFWSYTTSDQQGNTNVDQLSSFIGFGYPEKLVNVHPANDSGYFFLIYADNIPVKTEMPDYFIAYMGPTGQFDTAIAIIPTIFSRRIYPEPIRFRGVWENDLILTFNDSLFRYDRFGQGLDSLSFPDVSSTVSLNDSTLIVTANNVAYIFDTSFTITDTLSILFDTLVGIEKTLYGSLGNRLYRFDENYQAADSVLLPYPANTITQTPGGLLVDWLDVSNTQEVVVGRFDSTLNLLDHYNTQIKCPKKVLIASTDSSFAVSGLNNENLWFLKTFDLYSTPPPIRPFGLQVLSSTVTNRYGPPPGAPPSYSILLSETVNTIVHNNGTDTIHSFIYTSGRNKEWDRDGWYYSTKYKTIENILLAPGDTMSLVDEHWNDHYSSSNLSVANNNFIIVAENDTINFGCNSPSAPIILGVDDPAIAELNIDLYPNPSTGAFTLNLPDNLNQTATIELFDLMGKQVWTTNLQAGNNQLQLDQKLSAGVYVYHIKLGNRSVRADRLVVY